MAKKEIPATTAIRELKANNVPFEAFLYEYQEKGGTKQTAEELDVNEHVVIKTLVFDADGKIIIVLMHGDKEVSTKELARFLNVKKVEPSDQKNAMNATGYQFGGTSPFGTKKKLPIYIESSILDLDEIYINGGKRGLIVKISVKDLTRVLPFTPVNVAI
jgi:Cys-tRNA(Pro) deacylase